MAQTIYVLNGPNLNMLGVREPAKYGSATLKDVESLCADTCKRFGLDMVFRQSNIEGELVTFIQEARINKASGIVINPAAYTHTSVAILDALTLTELPVIEIHITNVHQRESFRHHSYVSKVARGVLAGFGVQGYALAIEGLAGMIGAKER
ncbi:type II 3-dehydroquinate dehydratase [Undibacter mobilis]|uniref:3-dehydroquinate dehydratase n=1 Tax=Undibacter mobilis TaxID=2292256 RepID=A0A371BD86_9BRAD|nr:type II 3-dehydroquinate dehydratase [Undibacter mobilis]RDV05544.1 type II 3-dehydroquinate dehydratase [Undibacter mobilis]